MKKIIPPLIIVGVGIFSVWKIAICLSCVADFGRDGLLLNWIINTAGKNLYGLHSVGVGQIFDGNVFYPYTNVLAYSEMSFLTALWAYPWGQLLHNPGMVSGLALVVGQIATMLMSYLWWSKLSGDKWAAAIMAIAFGASQIRFHYQVHLQLWSMQYFLLALWWIYSFIEDKKKWKLYAGFILLGLQVWESLLPVFFSGLILFVWGWVYREELVREMRTVCIGVILAGMVAAAPLLTYLNISREFDYQRSIRESAHNGMSVNELWERFASPGIYGIYGGLLVYSIRRKKGLWQSGKERNWLLTVTVASLLLALGPVLKWDGETVKFFDRFFIPMPYGIAYYTVPGFGALRTPSRWIWMFAWGVSGLAAVGLARALVQAKGLKTLIIIIFMLFAFIAGTSIELVRMLPNQNLRPGVYKWLIEQPGNVVLELPIVNDDSQTEAMLYLLGTDKKLINGYSGFYPPERARSGNLINRSFPNQEAWNELKRIGTNWVIIDKDRYVFSGGGLNPELILYEDERWMAIKVI
jgi:hypothetical protein